MRRSLCKCLLLPVLFLLPLQVMRAQDDYQYRLEMGAGVGLVAYEGDLNGNILAHQQPMAAIVGRYNFDSIQGLAAQPGAGQAERLYRQGEDRLSRPGWESLLLQQYPGGYEPRLRVQLLAVRHRQGLLEEPGGWCLSSLEVWEPPL